MEQGFNDPTSKLLFVSVSIGILVDQCCAEDLPISAADACVGGTGINAIPCAFLILNVMVAP